MTNQFLVNTKRARVNSDEVQNLTDEELAHFILAAAFTFFGFNPDPLHKTMRAMNALDWLRQEV